MNFNVLFSFKREKDPALVLFSQQVVEKTKGNVTYEPEQAQVTKVETATRDFETAIANASTGDRDKIKRRNEKRAALELELTLLGKMLEMRIVEVETFYTEAGFEVRKSPVRNRQPFDQPKIKSLNQGTLSGTIAGITQDFPEGVTQLAAQHSQDNGSNWENGTYSNGKRFLVQGLEIRKEYLVRVRFHGTHGRISDWSEPVAFFVK